MGLNSPLDLKRFVVDVPDFPSEGVVFRDITPLLSESQAYDFALEELAKPFLDRKIDAVAGIESRGFIFGAPLAVRLGCGFVPIRKKGKLPRAVHSQSLKKEYGEDIIEVHQDAFLPSSRVLLVDDVLATGGTLTSAIEMLKRTGAQLAGVVVLINLSYLPGEESLKQILPAETIFHHVLEY